MIPLEIKVIVKKLNKNDPLGMMVKHYKWPKLRIEKSRLITPRIGIVLYYKCDTYALVLARKMMRY